MRIFVKAKPASKKESVSKIGENTFEICVKEPPIKGLANAAVIEAAAKHFKVPLSKVRIVSGRASRQKILEIGD